MILRPITERPIGSIEVLLFVIFYQVCIGSGWGAFAFILIAVAFYIGRSHFKQDFSLAQLYGLFKTDTKETPKS